MLEWLKRHAWKACIPLKGITSSNLVLSAKDWSPAPKALDFLRDAERRKLASVSDASAKKPEIARRAIGLQSFARASAASGREKASASEANLVGPPRQAEEKRRAQARLISMGLRGISSIHRIYSGIEFLTWRRNDLFEFLHPCHHIFHRYINCQPCWKAWLGYMVGTLEKIKNPFKLSSKK